MKKPRDEQRMYYTILRAQHNYTIEDVAELSGTSTKSVWRFETGNYKRITKEIKKLMNFYYDMHKKILDNKGERL